jgi:hypothetical protein
LPSRHFQMKPFWKIVLAVLEILLIATSTVMVLMSRTVRTLQIENTSLRVQLAENATPETVQKTPEQMLYAAASRGQRTVLKTVLDANPELVNATSANHGATPLHVAAHDGRAWIVAELIRRNANVNATNDLGFTPLHDAITSGNVDVVTELLRAKPDLTIKNKSGQTPLAYATVKNRTQLADLIRNAGAAD